MKANISEVKKLIKEKFRNNNTWFAEEIGVDGSYVSTILNNPEKSNSNKFCNSLIKYCELNGLDFKKYIFLEQNIQKNEQKKGGKTKKHL